MEPSSLGFAHDRQANSAEWQALCRGGFHRPNERHRSTSGRYVSGDLVESRVANLIGAKLRGSLNHFPKCLEDSWIGIAVVGFRVLLLIPQADRDSFRSARNDERNFVLKAFLLSKRRNGFLLHQLGKLCNAIRLQSD